MARLLGLALVALLLAGCNDDSGGGADADEQASATQPALPRDETLAPAPLPSLEVFNDTLTFASATGGSTGSGKFEVPKGYGNLTIILTSTAQCPGYVKQAAVKVTAAGGLDESLPVPFVAFLEGSPVTEVGGYEPSSCSLDDLSGSRTVVATSTTNRAVQPGAGTLAAAGEFTGTVRVAVVAQP